MIKSVIIHINRPFEVCLLPVLPSVTIASAKVTKIQKGHPQGYTVGKREKVGRKQGLNPGIIIGMSS